MGCGCNNEKSFKIKAPVTQESGSGIHAIKSINFSDHTPYVSAEIQESRLEICKSCEFYTRLLNKDRCTVGNGSFLRAKTSLVDQNCPHPTAPKW